MCEGADRVHMCVEGRRQPQVSVPDGAKLFTERGSLPGTQRRLSPRRLPVSTFSVLGLHTHSTTGFLRSSSGAYKHSLSPFHHTLISSHSISLQRHPLTHLYPGLSTFIRISKPKHQARLSSFLTVLLRQGPKQTHCQNLSLINRY